MCIINPRRRRPKKRVKESKKTPLPELRASAHKEFDKLWQEGKYPLNRNDAYEWLAEKIEIPIDECHFTNFGRRTLNKVLRIMESEQKC